ncbi:hypothetical protein GCM10025734_50220 [Kitasatospora paranensis]
MVLRPIRVRDQRAWQDANRRNRDWLRRWEATVPPAPAGRVGASRPSYRQMVRYLRGEAAAGRMLPFAVLYRGRLVGQLTVGGITWGSMCSANVGYWVDEEVAGRGIMPTAVALAVDHCFRTLGLHRLEVCIRPENGPSRRVVEKLGFREEECGRAISTSTATGATISCTRSRPKRFRRACCGAGAASEAVAAGIIEYLFE